MNNPGLDLLQFLDTNVPKVDGMTMAEEADVSLRIELVVLFSIDRAVLGAGFRDSLVEELRRAGFRTAAFTEGGFVSREFGFDLGFDHFVEQKFNNPFNQSNEPTPGTARAEPGEEDALIVQDKKSQLQIL